MPIALIIVVAVAAFVVLSLFSYAIGDAIRHPETPKRSRKKQVASEDIVDSAHRPAAPSPANRMRP